MSESVDSHAVGATKQPITKVTVLSGFLGSGKTTVILHLIKQISKDYKVAWLKNEYGEVAVDSRLAAESNIAVTEVLQGCICCTAVGQLGGAMEELLSVHRPDRILLETSGSSQPAPIAWELRRLADAGLPIAVDAVICVIDAENFPGYEDKSRTARMQTQWTDLILINKHELVDEARLDRVLDDVCDLNPDTPRIRTDKGFVHKDVLLGVDGKMWRQQQQEADGGESEGQSAAPAGVSTHVDSDIRVLDLRAPSSAPFEWARWRALLQSLPRDAFYRIKGVLQLTEPQAAQVSARIDSIDSVAQSVAAAPAPATTTIAVNAATITTVPAADSASTAGHPADCSCASHSHGGNDDSSAAAADPTVALHPHLLNFAFGRFDLTPLVRTSYAGPSRVSFMGDCDVAQYSAHICQQLQVQPEQLRLLPLPGPSEAQTVSFGSDSLTPPLPPPPPPMPPAVPAPPPSSSSFSDTTDSFDTALDPPSRSFGTPLMLKEDGEGDVDGGDSASSSPSPSDSTLHVPVLSGPNRSLSASPEPPPVRFSFASLILIYCVVVADAIALNIVNPFISEMCEERFDVSPEAVGLASGALVGLFSLAVFLSSFGIGHLSDLYGRKKFMLLGLASGCVCSLVFGVARSFSLALLMRFVAGFTNANLGLTKTVIADVPSSEMSNEQRSLAFAYLGGCFQLSRAIASALAGVTFGLNFPGYDNDYFMPCFIAALLNFAILVFSAYVLPETLTKKKKQNAAAAVGSVAQQREQQHLSVVVERGGAVVGPSTLGALVAPTPSPPLVVIELVEPSGERMRINGLGDAIHDDQRGRAQNDRYERLGDGDSPAPAHAHAHAAVATSSSPAATTDTSPSPIGSLDRSNLGVARASPALHSPVASPRPQLPEHATWRDHLEHIWSSLGLGLRVVWADALVLKLIVLQCMHAFANGSFMLLLTLLGALAPADGGMGFTPGEIGVLYILFGVVSLTFQFLVYKHLHRRYGSHRIYLCGTWLLGGSAALMPLAGFIKQAEQSAYSQSAGVPIDELSSSASPYILSWLFLSLTLVAMAVGFMVCLPVIGAMMSHAVQGSQYRGLTLGVGQSLQSGFRGLGATVMGALFSYIAHATGWPAIVFWMLTLLNLACFVVGYAFSPADLRRSTGQDEADAEAKEREQAAAAAAATAGGSDDSNSLASHATMAAAAAAVAATMEEENRDRSREYASVPSFSGDDSTTASAAAAAAADEELERLERGHSATADVDADVDADTDALPLDAMDQSVSMEQAAAALDSWMEPVAQQRALQARLQPNRYFD